MDQDSADEPASKLISKSRKKKTTKSSAPRESAQHARIPIWSSRGWLWSRIGELCTKTGSGSTPRGGKNVYKLIGVPFIRSQNVYDDGLRIDDVAFIEPDVHARMAGTAVRARDLLLNITGGSMGRCCRVPDKFAEANVSQHVAIIRPAVSEMANFLHKLVLSPYFQAFIFDEQDRCRTWRPPEEQNGPDSYRRSASRRTTSYRSKSRRNHDPMRSAGRQS